MINGINMIRFIVIQFEIQKSDAIKFLTDNFDKLQRLSDFGLLISESPSLDFGVFTRMFDVGAQFDRAQHRCGVLRNGLGIMIVSTSQGMMTDFVQRPL